MADADSDSGTQIPAAQADPVTPPPPPTHPPGGTASGCKRRFRRQPAPGAPRAVRRRPLQSPLGFRAPATATRTLFADAEAAEATSDSGSDSDSSDATSSSCTSASSSSPSSSSPSSSSVSGSSSAVSDEDDDDFIVPDSSGGEEGEEEEGEGGGSDSEGSDTSYAPSESSGTREVCGAAADGTDATALALLVGMARRLGKAARPA